MRYLTELEIEISPALNSCLFVCLFFSFFGYFCKLLPDLAGDVFFCFQTLLFLDSVPPAFSLYPPISLPTCPVLITLACLWKVFFIYYYREKYTLLWLTYWSFSTVSQSHIFIVKWIFKALLLSKRHFLLKRNFINKFWNKLLFPCYIKVYVISRFW